MTQRATSKSSALKLFVSYSRRNMAQADALVADLEAEGFQVTIDRRDLPYGQKWQDELEGFINSADAIVWLVSPASLASQWCLWELMKVDEGNKRIVPVVLEEVSLTDLPEALGQVHLLPVEGTYDHATHFADLVGALRTDQAWVKEHTRLYDRARIWVNSNRNPDQLLRRTALGDAEAWRDNQPETAPRPTDDILALIQASRMAHTRGQRRLVVGSIAAAVIAVALSVIAVFQRNAALEAQAFAEQQQARAERSLSAAVKTADGLVFRISQQFRDRGIPNEVVRNVLDEARALQERLFSFEEDSPFLVRSRSVALAEYAATLADFGAAEEAIELLREAEVLATATLAERPDDPGWQSDLAKLKSNIAGILERSDPEGALALNQEVLGLRRKIWDSNPDNVEQALDFAQTLGEVALYYEHVDINQARALLEEAIGIGDRYRDQISDNAQRLHALNVLENRLLNVDERSNAPDLDARHEKVLADIRRVVELDPTNEKFQANLGALLSKNAQRIWLEDPGQALKLLDQALEIYDNILALNSDNTSMLRRKTQALQNKAKILGGPKSLPLYEQALAISRNLVEKEPEDIEFIEELSSTLSVVAIAVQKVDPDRAAALQQEQIDLSRRVVALTPENNRAVRNLMAALQQRANALTERAPLEAPIFYEEAIELGHFLVKEEPDNPDFKYSLGVTLVSAAQVQTDAEIAKAMVKQALRLLSDLMEFDPENTKYIVDFAGSSIVATQVPGIEGTQEAVDMLDQAAAKMETLIARVDTKFNRELWDRLLHKEGFLQMQLDLPDAAATHLTQLANLRQLQRLGGEPLAYDLKIMVVQYNIARRGDAAEERYREGLEILERYQGNGLPQNYEAWIPEFKQRLASALGNAAYDLLLEQNFDQSEAKAREGIGLDPTKIFVEMNLGHALMFKGQSEAAKEIFLKHKGETLFGKTWEVVLAEDFQIFHDKGMGHPLMKEVLGELGLATSE